MMYDSKAFDQIYQDYLSQVAGIDPVPLRDRLGLTVDGGAAVVPFFGIPHRVSGRGVFDDQGRRPSHMVTVILCKYLLLCPGAEPVGSRQWVPYRDFRNAAPFAGGFANNAEKPISLAFSGRLRDLERACTSLGGAPPEDGFSSDLAMRFNALPRVPVLLLFNDQDEEFPAHGSLYFERRAENYLDVECLAMTGWVLAERLGNR